MTYHPSVARLAPSPRIDVVALQEVFLVRLARHAKRLRRSVPDLTSPERQFLDDICRKDDPRYPMHSLVRLTTIAVRSDLAHHRMGTSECVRTLEVKQSDAAWRTPATCPWDQEDLDNAGFDTAMRHYAQHPCPETWAAACEAGERQLASTRAALDKLYTTPLRPLTPAA